MKIKRGIDLHRRTHSDSLILVESVVFDGFGMQWTFTQPVQLSTSNGNSNLSFRVGDGINSLESIETYQFSDETYTIVTTDPTRYIYTVHDGGGVYYPLWALELPHLGFLSPSTIAAPQSGGVLS